MRRDTIKITEADLKKTIKDYLAIKGIFSFPIIQGMGSYRGAPDRVIHYNGRVIYLEIKLLAGKMSDWQRAFQNQCELDDVDYHIIRSLEDLQAIIEPATDPALLRTPIEGSSIYGVPVVIVPSKSVSRRLKAQSSIIPLAGIKNDGMTLHNLPK